MLTVLLCALAFFTPTQSNPILVRTFCGVGAGLFFWQLILMFQAVRSGRRMTLEFVPVKSHSIQAILHLSIFAYWGFYWRS